MDRSYFCTETGPRLLNPLPLLIGSSVAAAAEGAPAGEEAGVRRGAVAQPQRASRHAHPKPLEAAALTISDAVLCSEMGVHFSPCGRLLAACVACQVSLPCRNNRSAVCLACKVP